MKINVNNIAQALAQHGIAPEKQGEYLTAAVARLAGYLLPIPPAPIESTQLHFKGALEGQVAPVLDALIERIPFDYEQALLQIRSIWELRYALVHGSQNQAVWALLDQAVKSTQIQSAVDFTDPALQLLADAIAKNLE